MAKKTWIEVALNGAWTRRLQPKIPVTAAEIVKEGVACVKAGAAVVHTHTLEPDSGKQNNSIENCVAFAGLAVDVLPLIPKIVALGGHVRVGLEDAPFHCTRTNVELVEAAVNAVQKAGSEPATAADIRAFLAVYKTLATAAC